jgi:hypothetical protein
MLAPGEGCTLYYDTTLTVDPGDVLQTTTGRRYLVQAARRSRKRPDRWYLDVIVMGGSDITPEGAEVFPIHWYSRKRAS